MMKGMVLDDNMSNLTSASNEASISSSNLNEIGTTNPNQPPPSKKKRNLPGNPDPDAEVVALSPTTLMATNRFMCEICNKGFKRDQNLQLHRRGHNLPWKLKQRANKDVIKKKVYVCPEPTCIHNDPSRALGDLTGIKKHFSRKHGEKKWKCEKCSKRYAVQSDWKAHSKICGTREYRCDCGTLFSRRDSFITHRAFCDALTEESTKAITTNPLFSTQLHNHGLQAFQLKREQLEQHHIFNPNPNPSPNFPPWLAFQGPPPPQPQPPMELSSQLFSPRLDQSFMHPQNHNPSPSPHMSATSLLQKASQMGVTMSTKPSSSEAMCGPHQADHMTTATTTNMAGSDLGLSSHEERESVFVHGLSSFGNKAGLTSSFMEQQYDQMMSYTLSSTNGFGGSSISSPFEEAFNGMLNQEMGGRNNNVNRSNEGGGGGSGLTRDFLGLGPFPNRRFSNMGGLDQINSSSSYDQMNQSQPSWQG